MYKDNVEKYITDRIRGTGWVAAAKKENRRSVLDVIVVAAERINVEKAGIRKRIIGGGRIHKQRR